MFNYTGILYNHLLNDNQKDFKEYLFQDNYVTFNSTDNENTPQFQFSDHHNIFLVFNGEIYNEEELSNDLKKEDVEYSTQTTIDIIRSLFIKYQEMMFQMLRGKFSIVIWDSGTETLYGARDHFGMKDLFYIDTEEKMIFSPQKKSISMFIEYEEILHDSLQHYLSFQYVPEPMTMTKGIRKIEPGQYFVKKPNQDMNKYYYWQSSFNPALRDKFDWIHKIQMVLYDSVNVHLRHIKDVGVFLSGGIDSTIILALAKKYYPNIKTFSVGFEREGFSEIDIVEETANQLAVENISYVVSPEEYIEILPKIMWHMEDPLADPSCVPLYFAAREARKYVTSILSGEGADELFGGYNIYYEPESLKIFNPIPNPVKILLRKIADTLPEGMRGKSFLKRGTTPLRERYIGNAKMFEEEEKKYLLKHYNENISYQDITRKLYDQVTDYHLVNQMQFIDINTWLRGDILLKAEKMSVANSLDVRMPFMDKSVFQIANEIPVDLKIANGTTKSILREAVKGIIPNHVLDRKKLGFPVPIRHWLKNELNSWARQLIDKSETDYLFHKSYILNLLEDHCQDKGDYSRKIWTVLMFMVWHQVFVEKKFDKEDLFHK